MTSLSRPSAQNGPANQRDVMWSRSEKTIARKAFDAALQRELQEVIQKARQKVSQIKHPSELWDLEYYLTRRRKEIDSKYEYHYSQLTQVFGKLLHEGRLDEQALRGLREDKLQAIRSYAQFLARMDAA
jgi:hypothetical protein